jgi:hypothetical protein
VSEAPRALPASFARALNRPGATAVSPASIHSSGLKLSQVCGMTATASFVTASRPW